MMMLGAGHRRWAPIELVAAVLISSERIVATVHRRTRGMWVVVVVVAHCHRVRRGRRSCLTGRWVVPATVHVIQRSDGDLPVSHKPATVVHCAFKLAR